MIKEYGTGILVRFVMRVIPGMRKRLVLSIAVLAVVFLTEVYAQSNTKLIQLRRDLVISEDYFGQISGIKVDEKGQIFVADVVNAKIFMFSPRGNLVRTIGRKGEGPGEFERIWGIQIGRKDSLFVYDQQLYRITVFAKNRYNKPANTIRISNAPSMFGGPATVGSLNSGLNGFWILKSGNFLLAYSNYYSPQNFMQPHDLYLFELKRDGAFVSKKPFLTVRDKQFLVFTQPVFMVSDMPYAVRPVIHVGPDGLVYYAQNSDLSINALDINGKLIKTIKSGVARISLNDRLWQEGLQKLGLQLSVADLERSRTPLPKYQPVFEDFLVDAQERVWVGVNTGDKDNYSWWIFNKDGEKIGEISLARSVVLKVVKGDYAYGIETGNLGVQSVIRYKILI